MSHCNLALAVSTDITLRVDLCLSPQGRNNNADENDLKFINILFTIILILHIMHNILSGECPPSDIGGAIISTTQG